MMHRRHSDRPSVELTGEERRCFAEIAAQLRRELDGLSFEPPERRHQRLATALSRFGGRAARWLVGTARRSGLLVLVGLATGWAVLAGLALVAGTGLTRPGKLALAGAAGLAGGAAVVGVRRWRRHRAHRLSDAGARP